jgi:hypothetical protein
VLRPFVANVTIDILGLSTILLFVFYLSPLFFIFLFFHLPFGIFKSFCLLYCFITVHLCFTGSMCVCVCVCVRVCVWWNWRLNSGLTLALAHYPLGHSGNPFCFSYFWDRVLLYALAGLDPNPPICASDRAGITGMCKLFLLVMVSRRDPPDLCLPSS